MPYTLDRRPERLHLLRLSQLLPHKVPVDQLLVVDADRHEQRVLYRAVHERLDDDAQHAVLGHAGLAGARAPALQEELHVVAGAQALVHVGVQDGLVDVVLAAHDRVDAALYEKST